MEKPNILYIFCDQFRRQAIGYMKEDPVVTPNLDRFAGEAVVFKEAVSTYPVCSPYRGILFTGMYPHENHIFTNCTSQSAAEGCYLHDDQVCLSDLLAAGGYEMGYIGKWHLDAPKPEQNPYTEGFRGNGLIWDAYTPPGKGRHGFDFWYSYGCYDWHMKPHYWKNDAKIDERIDVREWSVAHETKVAIDYIKNQDKPFALFMSFNPPHTDFDMFPQEYLNDYEGKEAGDLLVRPNVRMIPEAVRHVKNYFASITGIDENFGKLMAALREKGIEDNTIVVFTSDHGEMMGSQGLMHKNIWYEEAVGVPFLVRWPARFSHHDSDAQLSTIDILPTLLSMAGLKDRIPQGCSGYDFTSDMETEDYSGSPEYSLYVVSDPESNGFGRGLRGRRYTFILSAAQNTTAYYLYDRLEDPYELHNAAGENEEMVQYYLGLLKEKLEEIGDPFLEEIPSWGSRLHETAASQ